VENPQVAPDQDRSEWARPGNPSSAAHHVAPTESTTMRIPPADAQPETDRSHEPPVQPAAPNSPPIAQHYSAAPRYGQPPLQVMAAPAKSQRRFLRDPLSIVLALVIVMALLVSGLIGAEFYARKRAEKFLAAAAECAMKDKVAVSIGIGFNPLLLQYITDNYVDISIDTVGNQLLDVKGLRADITINDVTVHANADSEGTIGALDATITWTPGGIKETLKEKVPFLSHFIKNVTTNPDAGTIELSSARGMTSATLKPQVTDGRLSLEIVSLTAMRATLPHAAAQRALDDATSELTSKSPLDIRADSAQVTSDGVVAHFSARNASIPTSPGTCLTHI
jgi:hypothetical protein